MLRKIITGALCLAIGVGLGLYLGAGALRTAPAPAPAPEAGVIDLGTLYQCEHEDGASTDYPCYWDARVRGNGMYTGLPVAVYGLPAELCTVLPPDAWCATVE